MLGLQSSTDLQLLRDRLRSIAEYEQSIMTNATDANTSTRHAIHEMCCAELAESTAVTASVVNPALFPGGTPPPVPEQSSPCAERATALVRRFFDARSYMHPLTYPNPVLLSQMTSTRSVTGLVVGLGTVDEAGAAIAHGS